MILSKFLTYCSGFLAPVIVILTAYIAIQQYGLTRQKVRFDLYEPRMKIYRSIRAFLTDIIRDGRTSHLQIATLMDETSESHFLFGRKVTKYIDLLCSHALELNELTTELDRPELPVSDRRTELAKANTVHLRWLVQQRKVIPKLFARYLRIDA
jgi:hypothetical protein